MLVSTARSRVRVLRSPHPVFPAFLSLCSFVPVPQPDAANSLAGRPAVGRFRRSRTLDCAGSRQSATLFPRSPVGLRLAQEHVPFPERHRWHPTPSRLIPTDRRHCRTADTMQLYATSCSTPSWQSGSGDGRDTNAEPQWRVALANPAAAPPVPVCEPDAAVGKLTSEACPALATPEVLGRCHAVLHSKTAPTAWSCDSGWSVTKRSCSR